MAKRIKIKDILDIFKEDDEKIRLHSGKLSPIVRSSYFPVSENDIIKIKQEKSCLAEDLANPLQVSIR